MASAQVLSFAENIDTMTFPQGFAFIERTRRQVGMLMQLPNTTDEDIQELASIHIAINSMETRLRAHPDCP